MANEIMDYFVNELGETPRRAQEMCSKLERHPDIANEFRSWLKGRSFPSENENCVTVEGYCARKLSETTYLEPIGVYNYLIYLRENPKDALLSLKKGLPRK